MTDKWTIQVDFDRQRDDGSFARARTVYHATGEDVLGAYAEASAAFSGRNVKLGSIIPGHHNGIF